jgi:hypothetical protein
MRRVGEMPDEATKWYINGVSLMGLGLFKGEFADTDEPRTRGAAEGYYDVQLCTKTVID